MTIKEARAYSAEEILGHRVRGNSYYLDDQFLSLIRSWKPDEDLNKLIVVLGALDEGQLVDSGMELARQIGLSGAFPADFFPMLLRTVAPGCLAQTLEAICEAHKENSG